MSKNIAILMGGLSAEREVSIMSGNQFCIALKNLGHKITRIDPTYNLAEQLVKAKPDVVFNALHGTYGEDGSIPGLLEAMKIPYTHSGIMASSLAFNKNITKKILQHYDIRVPEWLVMNIKEVRNALQTNKHSIKPPYVIKPVQQGSSVGVYIFNGSNAVEIIPALADDKWQFGEEVMVEKYIPGKELSTAVLGDKAIGTLELRSADKFMDYTAKYTTGGSTHIYPAPIPQAIHEEAKHFAETAHKILCCRSMSRSDFRYDDTDGGDGKLYFLEVNTHPGFTEFSIFPDIARHEKISAEDICELLINEAKCEIAP